MRSSGLGDVRFTAEDYAGDSLAVPVGGPGLPLHAARREPRDELPLRDVEERHHGHAHEDRAGRERSPRGVVLAARSAAARPAG